MAEWIAVNGGHGTHKHAVRKAFVDSDYERWIRFRCGRKALQSVVRAPAAEPACKECERSLIVFDRRKS